MLAAGPARAIQPASTNHARTSTACPQLTDLPWYGNNKSRIDAFLADRGTCVGNASKGHRPLATFDWDNTVVKNDVGDATTYWMLRHDKIRQPPGADWGRTSPYLTAAATAALRSACGTTTEPGEPLQTTKNADCADEILSVYGGATTRSGAAAFDDTSYDHRRMEPAYAWAAQLLSGYSDAQLRSFAQADMREVLAAPEGTTLTIGTTKVDGWVRYYRQIRDLIRGLQGNGFNVWIVSASAQPIVQEWATGVGISSDHVLGIRTRTEAGRHTYQLQTCGTRSDAAANHLAISYMDGKRCWINKTILHRPARTQFKQAPPSSRQAFAAGDSDTDVTFVNDATGLRLALNRNKPALMCRAYYDADDKWLVNPMFIEPKGRYAEPYPCSSTAGVRANGEAEPVYEHGRPIPDQLDTVYAS